MGVDLTSLYGMQIKNTTFKREKKEIANVWDKAISLVNKRGLLRNDG